MSNPYKINVVEMSITEMLWLSNFDQMTTCMIEFDSSDEILLVQS